ncbi:site-specific DNA-methyltransferase [Macrococcus caseolyticus]|uniref:site-specific DNA-methyltransferase n=1 Tax=Macrococcoides caseolyticum TaxID=69966 RepID=UPI002DBB686C|nr:site-specific DNA-methyltransferase [Macrococcus caseolyticus]MEB8172098.1 site-specific DNA-methyltransferase [Macrococcus caseolyticus]
MDKLNMQTKDLANDKFEKFKELFPNAITETIDEDGNVIRAIDKDILAQEISTKVVEGREERYQFTWPDKRKAILAANSPTSKTLRPCREESVNFDETENLYIEGDNLEVLKILQETYLGKIKMIYIDPPYNTGNDFVYKDNFDADKVEYLEGSGQYDIFGNKLEQNLESDGRFHTNWINMIYPRIKLARNLLTEDGLIFISISDREIANLRKICDEIFGEINFIVDLKWANNEGGGSSDSKLFRVKDEHVLVYSKQKQNVIIKGIKPTNIERYKESDEYESTRGKYYLQKLGMGSIQYSESMDYPITMEDGTVVFPSDNNSGKRAIWRWSKKKFEWGLKNDYIVSKKDKSGKWILYTKQYLNADNEGNIVDRTQSPLGIISEFSSTQGTKEMVKINMNNLFSYPKPTSLIKYLLNRIDDKEFICLDFFSGSSSTADAIMQLNAEDNGYRKFIMVQLPEKLEEKSEGYKLGYKTICDIGKERIRRVGIKIRNEKSKNDNNLDIGFRVLKTDSSNMKNVYYSPEKTEQHLLDFLSDNIKEDRAPEDLLFQVMLDLGISLSSNIYKEIIDDKNVFVAADGFLIACFDQNLTDELVKEIAKKEPYYAIFRDSAMATDSVATNFDQIFENISPRTVRKVL